MISDDVKEKRNHVAVPAMIAAIKAQNAKIEKVLKMTQARLQTYTRLLFSTN